LRIDFALVLTDDPIHQREAGKQYEPQDCQELLNFFADDVKMTAWEVLSRYYDELNR
jgi:hypothetical protein